MSLKKYIVGGWVQGQAAHTAWPPHAEQRQGLGRHRGDAGRDAQIKVCSGRQ